MNLYKNTLKPFYRKNFKRARPYDLFHEHYAYYKTAVLEHMYNELANLYLENGYNYIEKRCFMTPALKELLASRPSREEFIKLQSFSKNISYSEKIKLQYVFVKGKSYNLSNAPEWKNLEDRVHQTFWQIVQKYYQFPVERKEFVKRLNAKGNLQALKKCRNKIYDQSL